MALSDYSALFQNNNDTMFDAVKFGVAIVTDKDFEALNQVNYSIIMPGSMIKNRKTEKGRKENVRRSDGRHGKSCDAGKFCATVSEQAINFTGDDMGSDQAMIVMLLYIVMAIMAFVFGITTSNTIQKKPE